MSETNFWCQESDELLKYLYQDLQIFNWSLISKEISQRLRIQVSPDNCRNRYQPIIIEVCPNVRASGPGRMDPRGRERTLPSP
jgi:hypothetical protein